MKHQKSRHREDPVPTSSKPPRQITILVDRNGGRGPGRGIMLAPARHVSAATINDMALYGRGVISACLTVERAFALGLRTMARAVGREGMPRFMVSVEAAACTETGISAAERALTLRVLGDPASKPQDLHMPGHIMPCLPPDDGEGDGLLATATRYMAAVSGAPVAAWCDILDESGGLASAEHCVALADRLHVEAVHLEVLRQRLGLRPGGGARDNLLTPGHFAAMRRDVPLPGAIATDPMLSDVR